MNQIVYYKLYEQINILTSQYQALVYNEILPYNPRNIIELIHKESPDVH